jgi:hypothetical protein
MRRLTTWPASAFCPSPASPSLPGRLNTPHPPLWFPVNSTSHIIWRPDFHLNVRSETAFNMSVGRRVWKGALTCWLSVFGLKATGAPYQWPLTLTVSGQPDFTRHWRVIWRKHEMPLNRSHEVHLHYEPWYGVPCVRNLREGSCVNVREFPTSVWTPDVQNKIQELSKWWRNGLRH